MAGVGEDEAGAAGLGAGLRDGEHVWGEVDAGDGAGGTDGVTQGGQGATGSRPGGVV
jgi:hypothetical protein